MTKTPTLTTSRNIAGLVGPTLIAVTAAETINFRIWGANPAAGVFLNGTLLFVGGLAIVRAHNLWLRGWPVVVTITGWIGILAGLFRMFAPELQLRVSPNVYAVLPEILVVLVIGIFLTYKAYWGGRNDANENTG